MSITVNQNFDGAVRAAASPVPLLGTSSDAMDALPGADLPTAPKSPPHLSQAQIRTKLDSALQKNGIHTEIENEKGGVMVVRFVQADTEAVIMQFPTQTVLDIVASLTKSGSGAFPALAGHLYDRNA